MPESAGVARRLVRTALAAWHQDDLIDNAENVITELVSNAVDHGRLPSIRILVTCSSEGWIRLGVVDRSRVLPTLPADSNGDQIRGRGMVLVDALSDRWGTDLHRWGKTFWAELKVEVER
ncbi:ATP-binding protein [Streptomyces bottropensis]|uniref:ATP-binding protein n=1 Tax=Streptomyces bottropensis TaxID=42235 RepID=UPI0036B80AF5